MKKFIIIEILLFIIGVVLVVKYDMIKTGIIYLFLCESLRSINSIMTRYLEELKARNERIENILKMANYGGNK